MKVTPAPAAQFHLRLEAKMHLFAGRLIANPGHGYHRAGGAGRA
ncbi:hypothetical protein [Candidatus Amarolinea dominans]